MEIIFFNVAVRTFGGSKYGSGIGEIYYKSVSCTGTETCLVTCPASTDTSSCSHEDDAGVRCDGEFSMLIGKFSVFNLCMLYLFVIIVCDYYYYYHHHHYYYYIIIFIIIIIIVHTP